MEEKLKEVQECYGKLDKVFKEAYDELKEKFFNTIPNGTVIYSVNDDESMMADGLLFSTVGRYDYQWMRGTKFLVKNKEIECIQAIEDDELTDIEWGCNVELDRSNYPLFDWLVNCYENDWHVPEDEAASIEITY